MREQTWGKIQRAVAPPKAAIDVAPVGKAVQGRFRATASGSDRPMRVVRRSASPAPPASLSGHSRIGADIGGVSAKSKQTPSAISAADHRERI